MSFTIHACRSTIRFRGTTVTDIAVSRGDTVPKGSSRSCSASDCGTEAKPPSGTGTPTLISGKAAACRPRPRTSRDDRQSFPFIAGFLRTEIRRVAFLPQYFRRHAEKRKTLSSRFSRRFDNP
ncbi:hypothetical protein ACS0Y3_27325 [Burkholderia gladioli]|uniref:hypothetical protein n=1 Tax=Burkholderia gladioli TaxID=28095 RepID=UPI00163F138D|nr:hypothetical protein [Burkholderia gladioli]